MLGLMRVLLATMTMKLLRLSVPRRHKNSLKMFLILLLHSQILVHPRVLLFLRSLRFLRFLGFLKFLVFLIYMVFLKSHM